MYKSLFHKGVKPVRGSDSMYKIILIGDVRVGKTSMRSQYMGQGFRASYTATLGVDYSVKETSQGKVIVYDLAGDRSTSLLRKQQYPNTNGVLMVFSIANRGSFNNLDYWIEELASTIKIDIPIFILGNKDDLRETTQDPVREEEGYAYSKKLADTYGTSVSYLSTSALTGYNVEVAFSKLLSEILMKQ